MSQDSTEEPENPPQAARDQLATAIESSDVATASDLLEKQPLLANADLRPAQQRDQFTNGLPIFRACRHNHTELATILLRHGANPNAPSNNLEDQPEFSLPLYFAAVEKRELFARESSS